MKMVVGLGNPGRQYANTRHNIGFMVLDEIANKLKFTFDKKNFDGLYCTTLIEEEKVLFLKPQKYMNLSGEVVKKFVDYYKINVEDILIIGDDLDLQVAKIRLRQKGSSGGHNGLKNIFYNLNTENIKRIKIGIANNKDKDTKDYVLEKFSKEQFKLIDESIKIAAKVVMDFIKYDFNDLMNKYN